MRFRLPDNTHTAVHTLNSTAVATSRALVAIMEQNQLEDGRVRVPDVLQPYMGGQEILEKCNW
jgi:seryl-tRNA synthetase